jgi:hypothetical protein
MHPLSPLKVRCVNQQMMEEETTQLLFPASNYQRQSAITPPQNENAWP